MFLVRAEVGPFRSIDQRQTVEIEPKVTVLVGMNEAGKTVFLQALEKSADALDLAEFDPIEDYPRRHLPAYLKTHKTRPANVTTLTYRLDDAECAALGKHVGADIPAGFEFTIDHSYANKSTIGLHVEEAPVVAGLAQAPELSSDVRKAVEAAGSIRGVPSALEKVSLTDADKKFLADIELRIDAVKKAGWPEVAAYEAWKWLSSRTSKCVLFGEYDLLPSKMNLADLANRVTQAKANPALLTSEHRAVLALLRMAEISMEDVTKAEGYEPLKAKLEGVSISLTDQIMAFWKQNEDLEVEVDIKTDPQDQAPYNAGPNLYLRIKNRRHRGVSTPFRQRSRGFIWFFSFLVWFDSVQHQLHSTGEAEAHPLILLLDEPGINLHALAQADFLRYIDDLGERHQVIYTTHSPFMIHSDRLHEVRVVEDRDKVGTVISSNLSSSDDRTVFPLQAALGWTLAQNLFISEKNLVVEGPADLLFLKTISAVAEAAGRVGLRGDLTIVPTGGLDKVVTFIALLSASQLKLVVLHDYSGLPEQKLRDLVREKLIAAKSVLDAAQFRSSDDAADRKPTDLEDLMPAQLYLDYFNKAYAKELAGKRIGEGDLPPGDRIVVRIERHLASSGTKLRPSGGFNHYLPALAFAKEAPTSLDENTLDRFERLFKTVNELLA